MGRSPLRIAAALTTLLVCAVGWWFVDAASRASPAEPEVASNGTVDSTDVLPVPAPSCDAPASPQEVVALELPDGLTHLTIDVRDASDGKPVAGAWVVPRGRLPDPVPCTDAGGRVELRERAPLPGPIAIEARGYLPAELPRPESDTGDLQVALVRAANVSVSVDPGSAPLDALHVEFLADGLSTLPRFLEREWEYPPALVALGWPVIAWNGWLAPPRSDAEPLLLDRCIPGQEYTLRLRASDGAIVDEVALRLEAGETRAVRLSGARMLTIAFQLAGPEGRPLSDAQVFVDVTGPTPRPPRVTGYARDDGRVELRVVGERVDILAFDGEGAAELRDLRVFDGQNLWLELPADDPFEVRVVERGTARPVPEGEYILRWADRDELLGGQLFEGRCVLPLASAGVTWDVEVIVGGRSHRVTRAPGETQAVLEVDPFGSVEVILTLGELGLGSDAVRLETVLAFAPGLPKRMLRHARLLADGSFVATFGAVFPGRYRVWVDHEEGGVRETVVTVPPGEVTQVSLPAW